MTARPVRPLAGCVFLALAACARLPVSAPSAAGSVPPATATATAPASAPAPPALAQPPTAEPPPPVAPDLWEALRAGFALDDCDSDPGVASWAARYTRNPRNFESRIEAVLPQLAYVQGVAAEHGVPAEFALLPWVESKFHPTPKTRARTAGMWQITPVTAGSMGLRVTDRYDGRLDLAASAEAVMQLLRAYHDQFGDWRVADYAYHAGASATARFIARHGMPPARPTIPHWPARDVTRQHLTKLLAISCVVREPERFHVTLPDLAAERRLVHVPLTQSIPLAAAASHAGMPLDLLKYYNAGFLGETFHAEAAPYLLLPARHARQFLAAPPAGASAPDAEGEAPAAAEPSPRAAPAPAATYRVRAGDSLWAIAKRYAVAVDQLRRWNGLASDKLRPGQMLRVGPER